MFPSLFLSHLIGGATGSGAIVLSITIILGTFLSEDITAVIVGVLAADGIISIPIALPSLFIGIVLGDNGLYGLGRLASTHPRLARYVDHDFIVPFRTWLEKRFVLTIFSARFIPGSRFLTYIATGFFRSRYATFLLTALVAVSLWTLLIFSAAYWFGSFTSGWFGLIRWGVAAVFLLAIFFIGRRNFRVYRAYRAKKNE